MHIFFDARWILVEDRFDGVSRYSHELAWSLSKISGIQITWIIYDDRQLNKLPKGPNLNHILVNNPSNIAKELTLPIRLNKAGAKIVYSPFFVMGTIGKKYKLVLTIHDLIYFEHKTPPQWLPWYTRVGWRLFHLTYWPMRWQLNKADRIATVSETAKNELTKANATKKPISTISNAVSQDFKTDSQIEHYNKNKIIYMGAFTPYKNVECLIDAIAILKNEQDITLHLCSKIPEKRRQSLEQYISKAGVSKNVVLHNGVTDKEYRELLDQSLCAISASKIEGFGLPLIETQQAGVPFIASDIPIFHEVGQKSVLYFNPDNPQEASDRIIQIQEKDTSNALIKLGYSNASRYNWSKSASEAIKICQSL